MIHLLIAFFILVGSMAIFVSGIGILRLPNLLSRMHAITNVSSFGLLMMLVAVNLYTLDVWVFLKSIIVFFVLINLSPMASFMLAKVSKLYEDFNAENAIDNPSDQRQ
jgi:monovalent cation/proton antiporter MnhG/PhaG subunit